MPLANRVFQCYDISEEDAASIGVPLAEALAEYLPETWLNTVASTLDPTRCLIALYLVVQRTMANERAIVEGYQERLLGQNAQQGVSRARQEAVGAVQAQQAEGWPEDRVAQASGQVPGDPGTEEAILAAADASGVE